MGHPLLVFLEAFAPDELLAWPEMNRRPGECAINKLAASLDGYWPR